MKQVVAEFFRDVNKSIENEEEDEEENNTSVESNTNSIDVT
jgi:hypothetical protein